MLEMNTTGNEENLFRDRVYAAMETGNHAQARTLLRECKDRSEALYRDIKMDVTAEYGITL